jgi:hypothetical protein
MSAPQTRPRLRFGAFEATVSVSNHADSFARDRSSYKSLKEALALEADERVSLAAKLLASLQEHEQDVQKACAEEIERRSLIASEERGTDWRAALEEIRAEVLRR